MCYLFVTFTSFSCCVWFITLCIIALIYLSAIFNNYFTANNIIHNYNIRSKNNLHISCIKSEYGKKLRFKASQLWNKLPDSLKGIVPITMFKDKLRSFLDHDV